MTHLRLCVFFALITVPAAANASPQQPQPGQYSLEAQPAPASPSDAMVVYVSDFDLDVVNRKPSQKPAARTSPPPASRRGSVSPSAARRRSAPASPSGTDSTDPAAEETPADQARALVNAVSENIIRAFTQAGYDARRLPAGAPLPERALRIRGVFAEADEQNRARRLLVGGVSVTPNMLLFVGVNNLTHPEQPLYELANPPANDPRHGPVITVTSYAPAERFELPRDPSGDELEKIATKIAADFSALVSVNRLSLAQ